MKLISYASSSRGNCHILEGIRSSLMLDCGMHHKKLSLAILNAEMPLCGILVTHSHKDHCLGLTDKSVALCGTKIYSNDVTLNYLTEISNYYKVELKPNKIYNIGDEWSVLAFEVPHDTKNYAYLIHNRYLKENTLYITDLGKAEQFNIKTEIQNIIIEANFNEDWYKDLSRIEEHELSKYRRLSSDYGHISVQQCMSFLDKNTSDKTKNIILVHISRSFDNYKEMEEIVQKHFEGKTFNIKAINNKSQFETTEL